MSRRSTVGGRRKRSNVTARLLLSVLTAGVAVGCSSSGSGESGFLPGYVRISTEAQRSLSLDTDSLPEVPFSEVTLPVANAADEVAHQLDMDPECNRFFVAGKGIRLVAYRYSCDAENVAMRDQSQAVGAVSATGELVGGGSGGYWALWVMDVAPSYRPPWDLSKARSVRRLELGRDHR